MPFDVTFGSVGDFIAICQLATNLAKALSDGSGSSSAEYQDLRKELDIFVQVLTHVEESRAQLKSHPPLLSLCRMIESVTGSCGSLIKDCLDRVVPKYSDSLRSGSSRPFLPRAAKMIQWAVSERQRLRLLQDKLRTATATLIVLVGLATLQLSRLEHQRGAERLNSILEQQKKMEETVSSQLTAIEDLGQQSSQRLLMLNERVDSSATNTSEAVGLTNHMLHQVLEDIQHVKYHMSNPAPQITLDPTKELPIVLEDALGCHLTVPMDWIENWDGFYKLLQLRFETIGKGQELIQRRQFALEDSSSGLDVNRSLPISVSFRRGMKIDMSMMFSNDDAIEGVCPKCRTPANAPENTTIQCTKCKAYFRFYAPDSSDTTNNTLRITDMEIEDLETASSVGDFQRVRMLPQIDKISRAMMPSHRHAVVMWYCHWCGSDNSTASNPSCNNCSHIFCSECSNE